VSICEFQIKQHCKRNQYYSLGKKQEQKIRNADLFHPLRLTIKIESSVTQGRNRLAMRETQSFCDKDKK